MAESSAEPEMTRQETCDNSSAPLPGLLRNRYGRFPVIRSCLAIIGVCLIGYYCSRLTLDSSPAAGDDPADSPPLSAAVSPAISTYSVKPGDTFSRILDEYGVSGAEALSFFGLFRDLGLSALYPDDSCVVTRDAGGKLTGFSLLNRNTHWYHLKKDPKALTVSRTPVAYSHYRCCVRGVLKNSLSADMYALGVGDALVCKLADIFAWDINFFTDPRTGDTFEVIFEKLYAEGRFAGYGDILAARYQTSAGDFYAIGMRDEDSVRQYYDLTGKSVQKKFLKAPLRYRRISSGYSYRRKHPVLGIVRPHLGIDYAAPTGTPVYAAADGVVRFSGRKGGYGKFVEISHGAAYMTGYGHLHAIARGIRSGARVVQGQMIGTVGATGLATGPHLDYRMKRNGRFVNPLTISVPSKDGVNRDKMPVFERVKEECLVSFSSRFPSRYGYWVLDISHPEGEKTRTRRIAAAQREDHVAGSGS